MKIIKMYQRKVVSREQHISKSKRGGFYWDLELECRHIIKLPNQRGATATVTHCEKCALGLVRA